jgi:hypothetical protein
MKSFRWHVIRKDIWPRVVSASQSDCLYDGHFSSACNVKDKEAKRKTTQAGNVSGGVQASTCRCSRAKHVWDSVFVL